MQSTNESLKFTWGKYREYAATSRATKAKLSKWRNWVLILSIGGAVFGVMCQESIRLELEKYWEYIPTSLGIISSLLLAVAAYLGKELVKPETERRWIRARSTAEALKSISFKFVTQTAPYDKPEKEQVLLQDTQDLLSNVEELHTATITEEKKLERILPDSINTDQYLKNRVDDQIRYYNKNVVGYSKRMKKIKNIGLSLGFVAVVFGILGSSGWTAGWIAVISTITASIAAYTYANRYQYLIISYQATGNRLEILKTKWKSRGFTDTDLAEKQEFVKNCEEAISIENSAWMAELMNKDDKVT